MKENYSANIVSLQFSLFFRDMVDRPDLEFSDINSNLMNIFDVIPTVMNIPKELPADIPIVTQRSESNAYVCNISRARIDLHFNRLVEEKSNANLLFDFNAKVNGLVPYVLKKREIVRFGMICRYFNEHTNPTEEIKKKYFKECIETVAELSFRYNIVEKIHDLEINDMIEIASAKLVVENKVVPGIFIQRDINNNVTPNRTITKDELMEISRIYAERIGEKSIEGLIKCP
jgi:hypothetical protein